MATQKTVAKTLKTMHREKSWRVIAREQYGDQVKAGTLCRIARSNGSYFPKTEPLRSILLGQTPPAPVLPRTRKSRIPRYGWLIDLPVRTVTRLINERVPMP